MRANPVLYSTLSSEAIKEQVLPHYGFADPAECVLFHRGLNDTYRVSTPKDQLAVRLYRHRWRTEDVIRAEIAALVQLSEEGVPCATPVSRADGEWLTPIEAPEGRRYAVVFRWLKGEQPRYIDATHARLYGQVAARLHAAGDRLPSGSGRVPLDLRHLLETPVARLRPPLASQPELLGRFDALVERVATRFEGLRSRLWDWGFCHGDLHAGNALVDGERLALFDFDCCGPGWRLYDLATYRWAARLRRVDAQAWSPFIEAYLAMRPKAADSIEHVPLFIVLRQIWLQGYYASNAPEGGVSYQSDGYFEGLVSFLEKLESESLS